MRDARFNFGVRLRDIRGYIVTKIPSIAAPKVHSIEFVEQITGVKASNPDEIA